MHQSIKFILFLNNTPHVSDGLSVHHQEFKTVHYSDRHLSNRYCCRCYVQSWTPDDGRKDRPKHVECHSKI